MFPSERMEHYGEKILHCLWQQPEFTADENALSDRKGHGDGSHQGLRTAFQGSLTGAYLTIEPKKGSEVPVAVWTVTETDEEALDRYEGCPVFYYKKDMELDIRGIRTGKMRKRKCFVYIMHEERKIGIPSLSYVRTCLEGYISFGFDEHYLSEAQIRAVKEAGYED